jgi:hypothetical protein
VVEQTRGRDGQLNLVSAAASVQRATSVAAVEAECGLGSREGPQVVRFLTWALELVLRWDGGGSIHNLGGSGHSILAPPRVLVMATAIQCDGAPQRRKQAKQTSSRQEH